MHSKLKTFSIAFLSILMAVGVGASSTNVNAKRYHPRWRQGMPKILHKNSYWISNYRHNTNRRHMRYVRYMTPLGYKSGVNLTPSFYNTHHHLTMTGSDQSALAGDHPYYEALGHGKYRIASGAMHKRHSLHDELYNKGDTFGGVAFVKMHGHNHLSMWYYDNNHMNQPYYKEHKSYFGRFTRHALNNHILRKVLKW